MSEIKKVVVIYPGRFQPFGKHHAATFLWIQKEFPKADCYIGTSNVTNEKSPFNFDEKKAIISSYGLGNNVKKVHDPYKAIEILSKYNKETTAVIFVVGKKDGERLSHGKYFEMYPGDTSKLDSYDTHGYIVIAPHIALKVPGFGEMSGTTIRQALGDTSKTRQQKKKLFNDIFGWYSEKLANLIFGKLEGLNEEKIPGGLAAGKSIADVAKHHNVTTDQLKDELKKGIKVELEHTTDSKVAAEIAMDHLWEDPKYYTKLATIEKDESSIKEEVLGDYKLFSTAWWKDLLKESLKDHAQTELKRAGLFDKDSDYDGMIGTAVCELIDTFSNQGHSGFSAAWVKELFNKLASYETITPLTSESDEWVDVAEIAGDDPHTLWQNSRNPAVFSKDGGKTMYHVDGKAIKNGIVEGFRLYNQKKKQLLQEGGAAGHMAHPFDLPQVKNGRDLVKIFVETAKSLQENPAAVKIDGLNATIKVVTKNGKMQFALDRGSMNPLDVSGVTIDDLGSRFDPGHGFLKVGKIVLESFNKCLPSIKSELEALGMIKDSSIMLNVEAVINNDSGKTNVISYKENFFVIHGLLKSEKVTDKRRTSKEVSGGSSQIQSIVKKCKPIMKKMGYNIYGSIPTTVKDKINFDEALNTPLTVLYDKKKKETKSLKQWLQSAKNPIQEKIKYINGKTDYVMTKKNYLTVLDQLAPLDSIAKDEKAQKAVIDGAVMYHATRLMGNAILKKLDSEVGDVDKHEGIVIRDPKISKQPFKITGNFISTGTTSGFQK